jgi:hypothetical protein
MRKISECALSSLPLRIQESEEWQTFDPMEVVQDRIRGNPALNRFADSINCEVRGDTLVLVGRLPSFYLKQVLQTALQNVPGVSKIDNRVAVAGSRDLNTFFSVKELVK